MFVEFLARGGLGTAILRPGGRKKSSRLVPDNNNTTIKQWMKGLGLKWSGGVVWAAVRTSPFYHVVVITKHGEKKGWWGGGGARLALANYLPNSNINLQNRQTQQYCGNNHESKVLVNRFGFTKMCFVSVLKGLPKLSTETCFFLSHEPKLLPKLASPIRDENSQNIAYWYKTYIR